MKIRICAINPAVVLLRYISNKDELRFKPTSLLYLVVVKNLETFFDSISSKHPLRFWLPEETTLNEDMKECIAGIEAYRKGKRHYQIQTTSLTYNYISTATDLYGRKSLMVSIKDNMI